MRGYQRIAAFFMLVLVSTVMLHFAINTGLRRLRTTSFGVSNRLVDGQINAAILITGSSRAVCHYDPRIIQKITGLETYNIGRNGSQIDLQVAVIKTYLKHNRRPKLLIQNLDLFTFVTTDSIYDPAQYMPYIGEEDIYNAVRAVHPEAWKWKHLPLYGYVVEDFRLTWILGIQGFLGISPPESCFQGYIPSYKSWTGDFETFRAANPDGVRFEIRAAGVAALNELLATCRDAGIPVVLVYSPVYHEMQQLERNRAEVFAKFDEVRLRYGVPLWDYSGTPLSLDRNLFYNSQHLNDRGAASFSQLLAERLVAERPWQDRNRTATVEWNGQ